MSVPRPCAKDTATREAKLHIFSFQAGKVMQGKVQMEKKQCLVVDEVLTLSKVLK